MTSLEFLDLIVQVGPNRGMQYTVPQGMYRLIARYEEGLVADERTLSPDLQERVIKHLPKPGSYLRGPDILLDDKALNPVQGFILFGFTEKLWVDLLEEEAKNIEAGDFILLGNTQLKVS
ncbi:MAG: hypothetical protein JKY15_08285 [Deltaproteobacteria bacterium]|nr:hypothetical protein [Deltaproteobacteria bacterium]